MPDPITVASLSSLLTDVTPLVAVVAPLVAAIRHAVPAIDGAGRVLGLIAVVAALILVGGFAGPWTPSAIALQLLRVLVLTGQTFGTVKLGDRWFGSTSLPVATTLNSTVPPAPAAALKA